MSRDFKRFRVWQQAYNLVLESYKIIDKLPHSESRNLNEQLRKAVTSIPLNIAEGSGSDSNKVFISFLSYAYKSAKECEVLFMLIRDFEYITMGEHKKLAGILEELKAGLYRLMQSVAREIKYGKKNYSYLKN